MTAPTLPLPPGQTPRPWQLAAVRDVAAAMSAGQRRVLVAAATGTGKGTLLAALAVRAALRSPGARVLVLCHRDELLRDLLARIARVLKGLPPGHGVTAGLVKAGENAAAARIVVASVQTLRGARLAQVMAAGPAPALVIVDEAHHAPARSYQTVLAAVKAARGGADPFVLGLTATPYRTGAQGAVVGLGDAFDVVAHEHGIVAAIAEGDLVPPEAVRVDIHMELDLSGVSVGSGGDYDEDELAKVVDVDARNTAIAEYVAERLDARQVLAFAVSVAHAKRLAEALRGRGVAAEAVWGGTKEHPLSARERAALISRFARGDLQVLVSRDLLFEGFDAPSVEVLIACRPTASPIIAAQLVGRGLRTHTFPATTSTPARVKQVCEVWDFVGFLDGVRLDLGADLSRPGADLSRPGADGTAKAAPPRPLAVGDLVELVLPPSRGQGTVVEAAEDSPLVRVRWPDWEEAVHGRPEIVRVPPGREGPAAPLSFTVRGMRETAVFLLPGQAPQTARPWVWAVDAWACGGIVRRGSPPEGLPDVRARGLVRQVAPGTWEAWVGVWTGRKQDTLRRITPRPVPLAEAQRAVDVALDEVGARRGGWDAPWRAQDATEAQVRALRALGRRNVAGVTKGEAGDLLDAQIVRRAVREEVRGGR